MSSVIIALANHKGGVGKTTVAVHVAYGLAALQRRVLLVDLDPQGSAGNALGAGLGPETARLLSGTPLRDCVQFARNGNTNLDLVRSGPATEAIAGQLAARDLGRTTALKRALRSAEGYYEFVLLDCPPGLSVLTVNALAAARWIMAPVGLSYLDVAGLVQLIETVSLAHDESYPVELRWIVPNLLRPTRESWRSLQQLRQHPELGRFVTTAIPLTTDIPEAQAAGLTVFEHKRSSIAAKPLMDLIEQVWYATR